MTIINNILEQASIFLKISSSTDNSITDAKDLIDKLYNRIKSLLITSQNQIDNQTTLFLNSFLSQIKLILTTNNNFSNDIDFKKSLINLISYLNDFQRSPSPSLSAKNKETIILVSAIIDDANKLLNNLQIKDKLFNQNKKPINPNSNIKKLQKKLNELLVPIGKIVPIDEDGILGNETQKALSIFMRETSSPSNMSQDQLFNEVLSTNDLKTSPKSNVKV